MARSSELTQEAVNEAAEQLKAQGKKASPNSVREILGTGSFSTIKKMLDAWRDKQTEEEQIPIPPVPDLAYQLVERLHKELYLQNYQAMQNERQLLEAERKDFENERTEMLAEISNLEEKNEALENDKKNCREQLSIAQEKLEAQTKEANTTREALNAAQIEVATLQEREKQLHAQLEDKEKQLQQAAEREQALRDMVPKKK